LRWDLKPRRHVPLSAFTWPTPLFQGLPGETERTSQIRGASLELALGLHLCDCLAECSPIDERTKFSLAYHPARNRVAERTERELMVLDVKY
jgi:hypothetical protein